MSKSNIVGQPATEDDIEDLKPEPVSLKSPDILAKAVEIADVNSALYVNNEGLVVDSRWDLHLDQNVCGATLKDMGRTMDEQLLSGSFGCMQSVLIETNDLVFYVNRNNNGAFIFVASVLGSRGAQIVFRARRARLCLPLSVLENPHHTKQIPT